MMRRQARSSTRITGRRELHDLGSRACQRSESPAELADHHETGRHATTPKPWVLVEDVADVRAAEVAADWNADGF